MRYFRGTDADCIKLSFKHIQTMIFLTFSFVLGKVKQVKVAFYTHLKLNPRKGLRR